MHIILAMPLLVGKIKHPKVSLKTPTQLIFLKHKASQTPICVLLSTK